jgi:hypothetical protein
MAFQSLGSCMIRAILKIGASYVPSMTLPTPLTHSSWVKVWDFKVQGPTLIGRVASAPLSPCSSQNDGELPSAEPLANPLSASGSGSLKDAWFVTASHLSLPLLVKVSWGQQPWEILVVPVDPSGEFGFATRATREQRSSRTSAAHTSRVALAPGKTTVRKHV